MDEDFSQYIANLEREEEEKKIREKAAQIAFMRTFEEKDGTSYLSQKTHLHSEIKFSGEFLEIIQSYKNLPFKTPDAEVQCAIKVLVEIQCSLDD